MFNLLKTLDETKLDNEKINIQTHHPVYITMSTIPSRLKSTFKIIKHFLKQTTGIEKFILNVPYKYNRFPLYTIETSHDIDDPRFILNRTEDYGPITKILPSLDIIPNNSVVIICDDMCYKLKAFKDIAEIQDREKWRSFSFYVYPYGDVRVPQGADLISSYSNNLRNFKKWFLDIQQKMNIKDYFNSPCFFVDDQVIGWYFKSQDIPLMQVERKHRMIYIKDCDKGISSHNLNNQKGKNSRENTMKECYKEFKNMF